MKHLFLARSGKYDSRKSEITPKSRENVRALARSVRAILDGGSVYLVSSTAQRAMDTGRIICSELGLTDHFETSPVLWSGLEASSEDAFDYDPTRVMDIVKGKESRADCLILVTHYGVIDEFGKWFYKRELKRKDRFEAPKQGQAAYFDLEKRGYRIVPPLTGASFDDIS